MLGFVFKDIGRSIEDMVIPSASELKLWSDTELKNNIDKTANLIKQSDGTIVDRHHKMQLYRALLGEQVRRLLLAESRAISDLLRGNTSNV